MNKVSKNNKQRSASDSSSQEKKKKKKHKDNVIYKCACKKQYGSLAAVHTHINNKHPQQKAKYKSQIVNPFKKNRTTPQTVRTKDIKFHKEEAALMIEADKTVKLIFQFYKEREKIENILDLEESDEEQSQELDINCQEIFLDKQYHRQYKKIEQSLKKKFQQLKISQEIAQAERNAPKKYQTFKLQKFNLNMSHEVSKHFTFQKAYIIQLQLALMKAKEYFQGHEQEKKLIDCENQILKESEKNSLKTILSNYMKNWSQIMK